MFEGQAWHWRWWAGAILKAWGAHCINYGAPSRFHKHKQQTCLHSILLPWLIPPTPHPPASHNRVKVLGWRQRQQRPGSSAVLRPALPAYPPVGAFQPAAQGPWGQWRLGGVRPSCARSPGGALQPRGGTGVLRGPVNNGCAAWVHTPPPPVITPALRGATLPPWGHGGSR